MADTTDEIIRAIIAGHARIDASSLSGESALTDLGIDSLDTIEIVFAIEERFGIDLPFNANAPGSTSLATVADVTDLVQAKLDAG